MIIDNEYTQAQQVIRIGLVDRRGRNRFEWRPGYRQTHPHGEAAALPGLACQLYRAAHHRHQATADAQAETGAAEAAWPLLTRLHERREQQGLLILRNADACVGDCQQEFPAPGTCVKARLPVSIFTRGAMLVTLLHRPGHILQRYLSRVRELDRIRQQIAQHLP